MFLNINKCPYCNQLPTSFWKKSTTGFFLIVYCQHCNCKLKLNSFIAFPFILLQWISLPIGAIFGLDIFVFILDFLPSKNIIFFFIPIFLGILLAGLITTIIYYLFVPWKSLKDNK
jgi:hypothetical protein